mgnify:CR=1 FL=1
MRRSAAAAELDTASVERFQTTLPFEPVNVSRLAQLKAERAASRRSQAEKPAADYAVRRARAQMEARRALAAFPPDIADAALLADSRLILKIEAQSFIFVCGLNFPKGSQGSF